MALEDSEERKAVLAQIAQLMAQIVEQPGLTLHEGSTAKDFPWWDSLNHLKLIVALEDAYRVRFEPDELGMANTVGALVDLVQKKRSRI